ncbi:expressed unknown protein [Seminavis robusta]|uniref:Uncharacterized protein n=1 Tax=Seminavis robusta TaxID=568900 RepID=A0A9N8HGN4_9STRA|nr:expressed unknown protein [Seminavis robusta]|eukprot:Sro647_g181010.1 n/a (140) ;mRNA; r:52762-53181
MAYERRKRGKQAERRERETSSPLTILHADDDSVEVNVAPDPRTGDLFFAAVKAKERELLYQKLVLEGCQRELNELKERLEVETDPEGREVLVETARKFAIAFHGKKAQFLSSYSDWRSSMLKCDHDVLRQQTSDKGRKG